MEIVGLVLLLIVSFLSSIMGSMIGGGMLILLPVMIFLGIPVHTSIATARFSVIGTNIGNITNFSRNGRIRLRYVLAFAIAGVVGSFAGASFLTKFDEHILKITIGIFMITVSIVVILEDFMKVNGIRRPIAIKHHFLSALSGAFVGAYIGIIGGGAATIVILLLVLIYGLSFHDAVANQKAVTLPIALVATIVFMYQGIIDYGLGIPLFIANLIGGWIGAWLVLKFKGVWLKRLVVPVAIVLAIKLIFF